MGTVGRFELIYIRGWHIIEDDIELFRRERSMFSESQLYLLEGKRISHINFTWEFFSSLVIKDTLFYSKLCSIFTNDWDCLNNERTYRKTGNHSKQYSESTSFCLCHCDLGITPPSLYRSTTDLSFPFSYYRFTVLGTLLHEIFATCFFRYT